MAHDSTNPLMSQGLSANGIYLRALEPTDLEFLYEAENDPAHWPVSNTVAPYSKAVLEDYLHNAHHDIYTVKQLRLMICRQGGQATGTVDLYEFDPVNLRAGVGIMVRKEFRQQQVASTALGILHRYCSDVLHLHQLYCTIPHTNKASLALFKKQGYVLAGTRKDWLRTAQGWQDAIEMQKIFESV